MLETRRHHSSHAWWGTHGTTVWRQWCDLQMEQWWIYPKHKVQGYRWEFFLLKKCRTHAWWKRGAATPISNIDNFVKHIYREHNQEADHRADMEHKGQEKLISIGNTLPQHGNRCVVSGMEALKTTAGVVAKWWSKELVDREKVTISKIAVPLKVCAAEAAEVIGVCVLTTVLDLILCRSLSVQNINQRINRFFPCWLILIFNCV